MTAIEISSVTAHEISNSDSPGKPEIEEYITDLHKTYKQKTVKRKLASVKAFYNYLEEEEFISGSPGITRKSIGYGMWP